MARAISIHQLMHTKYDMVKLDGDWADLLGDQIELKGGIFIWGDSGFGKTRFSLKLAKYLSQFERVLYNSMEEGNSATQQIAWQDAQMVDARGRVHLLDNEPISELRIRLSKRQSPRICFIDSFQYSGLSFEAWKKLKDANRDKLFVFLSHAEGRKPQGRTANRVRYDCGIKIFINGFVAYPRSRYGGNKPMVLWEEGARRCHGDAEIDRLMEYGREQE